MVRFWVLVLVVGSSLCAACQSEASVLQHASRAFAPVGDLALLSTRDLSAKTVETRPTNLVPDSKVLYDVQNVLLEAQTPRVLPEVIDQVVYLRGTVLSKGQATEIEASVSGVFGVRGVVNQMSYP